MGIKKKVKAKRRLDFALSDLSFTDANKVAGHTHVEMTRLFRREITRSESVVHAWRQVLALAALVAQTHDTP
jgi:hypothetical protein